MAVSEPPPREGVTRRQLLGAGGLAALAVAGVGATELTHRSKPRPLPGMNSFAAGTDGSAHAFHSQPNLRPPTVTTTYAASTDGAAAAAAAKGAARVDPEFLFLGPGPTPSATGSTEYGPLIVDRAGTPVWFRPLPSGLQVTNFTASEYRGEPVLVWWEGKILIGLRAGRGRPGRPRLPGGRARACRGRPFDGPARLDADPAGDGLIHVLSREHRHGSFLARRPEERPGPRVDHPGGGHRQRAIAVRVATASSTYR